MNVIPFIRGCFPPLRLGFLTLLLFNGVRAAFEQGQQIDYMNNFDSIIEASYAAVDDVTTSGSPSDLLSTCKKQNISYIVPSNEVIVTPPPSTRTPDDTHMISINVIITSQQVQTQCDLTSICIIPEGLTLRMTTNLNVGALIIRGSLEWNDSTLHVPATNTNTNSTSTPSSSFLCSGYIAVENNGSWNMNVKLNSHTAWIYIKDNGATHPTLRTRAFGAYASNSNESPTIDIQGRELVRTWSLLSQPLQLGQTTMKLMHNPLLMKWNVGDRIGVATTRHRSQGTGATFTIQSIQNDGTITLSEPSPDTFDAEFIASPSSGLKAKPALKSAEVVNLDRSIVITGDDFSHVPCQNSLPEVVTGEQTSSLGCKCASFRWTCTMGLHTAHMYYGVSKIQNTRIEKCGQRGVEGKYCMHLHKMEDCPDCLYKNNAIENSHQRGIIIHGTHRSTIEENVLYNVRGAGIYIEDGNEMHNYIQYNVILCPFPFKDPVLHGCTIPGTSNRIADTKDNQSAIYSRAANNDLIGNRASNSFNGMLVQALGNGRGSDNHGKVCESDNRIGQWIGNVFHSHGRFGTYSLGNNYPKVTDQSIANSGHNSDLGLCSGFDESGNTRGLPITIKENLDYRNAFVGHYNAGDIQYQNHHSFENLNLIYWKETKNFEDGCAAHISNGHYSNGNMALPDQSTFIIEQTTFGDNVSLEANHHCNVGVTGVLCMPQYILHNVNWMNSVRGKKWVIFTTHNTQGHQANQNHGGIFTLSPPDADFVMNGGSLNGSMFPPGFVSVVSSKFDYLLSAPNNVCVLSSSLGSDMGAVYDNGILCKVPLRSIKVYSRNLVSSTAPNMLLKAWFGTSSSDVAPHSSQSIGFHQVGDDNQTSKQGYSFPVVPGSDNTYRISLVGSSQNIPSDWVVEFSDWVMGNRWSIEYVNLELQGRICGDNGLINSHHDRKFIWSGDEFLDDSAWGSHGACTSSTSIPDDMPIVNCTETTTNSDGLLNGNDCSSCTETCNSNSYCDCGSQSCRCKPGFGGSDCSVDLCAAARCDQHGSCSATYLGTSSLLPVTSDKACICEEGWTGNLCQFNPCLEQNLTCSGHGTCVAVGDSDAMCRCNSGYSGKNCETSCDGFCQGSYPYNCNPNLPDTILFGCNQVGGCSYRKEGEGELGSDFCVFKEVGSGSPCVCESPNECSTVGLCDDSSGTCPEPTPLEDNTPCNSVPFGTCQSGICVPPEPEPPCNDSPLAFKILIGDKMRWKTCKWAEQQKERRCATKGIKLTCPATCNTCNTCKNSPYLLKIPSGTRFLQKNCSWVSKKNLKRCKLNGVKDSCRTLCNNC